MSGGIFWKLHHISLLILFVDHWMSIAICFYHNHTIPPQVAVKDATFEENHNIACAWAKLMNDGKPFADMMVARDAMQREFNTGPTKK